MDYEEIIGRAMLGMDDASTAERRYTCKAVASRQMFCPCGKVLDQSSIIVLEGPGIMRGYCSDHAEQLPSLAAEAAKNAGQALTLSTWNDSQTFNP